jgi:hypothetical protein
MVTYQSHFGIFFALIIKESSSPSYSANSMPSGTALIKLGTQPMSGIRRQ